MQALERWQNFFFFFFFFLSKSILSDLDLNPRTLKEDFVLDIIIQNICVMFYKNPIKRDVGTRAIKMFCFVFFVFFFVLFFFLKIGTLTLTLNPGP